MSSVEPPPCTGPIQATAMATLRDLGLTQKQLERYLRLYAFNIHTIERAGDIRGKRSDPSPAISVHDEATG